MKSSVNFCWECGSPAETQFVEGRDRKVCEDCGKILYQNPLPTTAAIVVNEQNELLLVRRSEQPALGEWCLPGGFLELGETPEEGVLRELLEETNLTGEIIRLIGLSPTLHGFWGDVLVIGFQLRVDSGILEAGDDAMEARYFPLDNYPNLAFDTHQHLLTQFLNGPS